MTGEAFAGCGLKLEWPETRIAVVTFIRERYLNSLSLELIAEFKRALDICVAVRPAALIVTGAGRGFCSGADLNAFFDDTQPIGTTPVAWRDRYLRPMAELFDGLETLDFPIIAAINGFAFGGGAELALSSDFRLMSRSATFGLPETRIGAIPGAGGVQKLIRHVGRSKALEWILLGAHVSAEQLDRAGLLYAITEPEELMTQSMRLARTLAQLSPAAIAQAKRCIYLSEDADLKTARSYGLESLTVLMSHPEWREGVRAFIEKRPPDFLAAQDSAAGSVEEAIR